MFYQVQFHIKSRDYDSDENNLYGGLGEYGENDTLLRVICGCCGSTFKPGQVEIVKRYENWDDVSRTIAGEITR